MVSFNIIIRHKVYHHSVGVSLDKFLQFRSYRNFGTKIVGSCGSVSQHRNVGVG